MASLLLTIGGAVVNALAFSGTNFIFSRVADHGEEECKRYDLALERLQKSRDEWSKDGMKRLGLSTKDYMKKMRERHTSAMLVKQWLNTIEYLQSK